MTLTATQQRGIRSQKTISENGVEVMKAEVPYLVAGLTSLTQAAHEVTQATGLPAIGSSGHGAVCIGYRMEQPTEATASSAWRVWVQYGQWPAGSSSTPESHDPNPVNRPASITRRVVERMEMIRKDVDDNPIINPVGDPFDPGIEESEYRLVITIQRYIAPANALRNAIRIYAGKVNDAAVGPFGVKELLVRDIIEVEERVGVDGNGDPFHVVNQTISLEADLDEWAQEVLAQGPNIKDADGNIVVVTDDRGVATGEIVLLAQDGTRLAVGQPPHFMRFNTKKTVHFGALNLPAL